jgi:hypothetical protein
MMEYHLVTGPERCGCKKPVFCKYSTFCMAKNIWIFRGREIVMGLAKKAI